MAHGQIPDVQILIQRRWVLTTELLDFGPIDTSDPESHGKKVKLDENLKKIIKRQHTHRFIIPCAIYAIWNYHEKYFYAMPCGKLTCKHCHPRIQREKRNAINKSDYSKWDLCPAWDWDPKTRMTYYYKGRCERGDSDKDHKKCDDCKSVTHVVMDLGDSKDIKIMREAWKYFSTYCRRGIQFEHETRKGYDKTVKLPPREDFEFIRVIEVQYKRFESILLAVDPDLDLPEDITYEIMRILEEKYGEEIVKDAIAWHFHVLTNYHFTKYDIYPLWTRCLQLNGSKSKFNYCECTWPSNHKGGDYLSKYFTKLNAQILLQEGLRKAGKIKRITCSRKKDADWVSRNLIPTKDDLKLRVIEKNKPSIKFEKEEIRLKFPAGKDRAKAIKTLERKYLDENKQIWIFMLLCDALECVKFFNDRPNAPIDDAYIWELKRRSKIIDGEILDIADAMEKITSNGL